MKLERKLDKVLNILYDKEQLTFKNIPTTDIVIFGRNKYKLEWTDAEVLLIMDILQDEGYVVMNKGDFSGTNIKMPSYSLTSKGILLKQNGGFVFKRWIEWLTNFLIIFASIVTILVGIATSIDLYNKYSDTPSNTTNQYDNTRHIDNTTPKTDRDVEMGENKQTTDNTKSNDNSNKNKMDTITNSNTITDSIQKTSIRTTNK